mgnify:CR=1 FL=1
MIISKYALPTAFAMAWFCFLGSTRSEEEVQDRYIVVLFSSKDFRKVEKEAHRLAKSSGTPFATNGHIYDSKKGLVLPEDSEDEMYRGQYLARRFHSDSVTEKGDERGYLSIEKSEAYKGLRPDEYVVVAGIRENKSLAQKDLDFYRTWAPGAFYVKCPLYLGCIH